MPSEPILRAFKNIMAKDAVLAPDLSRPQRPDWPAAEFIVGNPPFIGGKDIRARLGDDYVEALWAAHPHMNESADFVMYWWDRAAELLKRKGTVLRRFGLVTTNSISQVFQRRVVERHLTSKKPASLVMAIPDHPWTKLSQDAAAVRIAMTVGQAGLSEGVLREVVSESGLDTDEPLIEMTEQIGAINSDLTVGVDVTTARSLAANDGVCSPGVKLHGSGFIIMPTEAALLGLGRRPGLEKHIRHYRNGRDLTSRPREAMVIDLFGLQPEDIRHRFPEVYQHLLRTVKPERDVNNRETYRTNWWVFGEPRRELRPALVGLARFIATVETTKHRVFQFLDASILPDNRLVVVASSDAFHLGVLQSSVHLTWVSANGGTLEDRPIYTKSRCFDPFPFPIATEIQKLAIGSAAEDIDAHLKRALADHPHLTLTGLYNTLEMVRADVKPDSMEAGDRRTFDDGLVLILKELHDKLDKAVSEAYGWPAALSDNELLARLVSLNKERATEEAGGLVRWLRPDYQVPRFGTVKEKAELDLVGGSAEISRAAITKPSFPTDEMAQTAAVMSALAGAVAPVDATMLSASFKQGRRALSKVQAVLSALTRTGYVTSLDGGRTFQLRRAA